MGIKEAKADFRDFFYLVAFRYYDLLECLESVALKEDIGFALVMVIGAVHGARIVVGSREPTTPPEPVFEEVGGGRELMGTGTIMRDSDGAPSIHLHGSLARGSDVRVGCLRQKAGVYLVAEAVILEVDGLSVKRIFDEPSRVWKPQMDGGK